MHKNYDEMEHGTTRIIFQFHKNWIDVHRNEPEKLIYSKAMDALIKSLRAIINRSSDLSKIWKANELLAKCQASTFFVQEMSSAVIFQLTAVVHDKEDTTFSCPSEDLLDRCGCDVHNKEDATFSCPSDDLLDRYG